MKENCQFRLTFFGLSDKDKLNYVYAELYQLVEHCKITFSEAYKMPIWLRKWWITKKSEEIEARNEETRKQQRLS